MSTERKYYKFPACMTTFKSKKLHKTQVLELQKKLKKKESRFSLSHSNSNTLRNGAYKNDAGHLDLSALNQPLFINFEEKWIEVEPKMTIYDLTRFTLKFGLMPFVVPEFTSITVGGAIMGAAIESSSFKYGQFNDSALSYEALLGDGTVIHLSPNENSELFYALTGSYGTLAILTSVKLKLKKAHSHVILEPLWFSNTKDLIDAFKTSDSIDFLEGISFSPTSHLLLKGRLSSAPTKHSFKKGKKWFYASASEIKREESLPLLDYLFRFDKGAFWMGRHLPSLTFLFQAVFKWRLPSLIEKMKSQKPPFHPSSFFLLFFNWAFSSKFLYNLWHKVPKPLIENLFFIQDFYAPIERADEVLEEFMKKTEVFPIWLCPVKGTQNPEFLSPHFGHPLFLNIGLYGIPKSSASIPELTSDLEKRIVEYGGKKMLYSLTYYEKEAFARIYDDKRYSSLRKKVQAESFPTLFEKVTS